MGLSVRNPTSDELKRLGRTGGVLANLVETGGAAENAGIRIGDLVIGIDEYDVTDFNSYRRLGDMMKRTRRPLLFHVLRARQEAYFALEPEE